MIGRLALWVGLGVFFVVPLVLLLLQARDASALSVWSDPASLQALAGTVTTSLGAAAFALIVAFPLAILLTRTALPMHGVFRALFTLPAWAGCRSRIRARDC